MKRNPMNLFLQFLQGLWGISLEAAPYLLIGFFAAALLHRYVSSSWLVRMLGKGRWRPAVSAAVLGIPLPLCSCSVVPTALAIQKKGASKGATLSFFIATPETGVDSILLTYGLLGPVMAVARPLAAGISAIGAGWLLEAMSSKSTVEGSADPSTEPGKETCCSSPTHPEGGGARPCCGEQGQGGEIAPPACCGGSRPGFSLVRELREIRHSFLLLFDEIAVWVALGLVLSALAAAFLPEALFASAWGSGWRGMLIAILVGLPIYVCATASTPLAAVMVAKGFSVGAALVFLLVGPATNLGTLAIVWKLLGKRAVFAYLFSIVAVAWCFGWLVDGVFPGLSSTWVELGGMHHEKSGIPIIVCAIVMWVLLLGRMVVPLLTRWNKSAWV
jgi:uncharacterized membrane protein YraQ (UPF0718 family)